MSKQMQESVIAPVGERVASQIAQAMLVQLDEARYRGGRAIEYRDPHDGGLISVRRDDNGRVHIRTPRGVDVSVRLNPKNNLLKTATNKQRFEAFLSQEPLALSFLAVVLGH